MLTSQRPERTSIPDAPVDASSFWSDARCMRSGAVGSPVTLASVRHQRPDDARHPVGQRHVSTSMHGLRASILASHGSFVLPRRTAQRTTAMALRDQQPPQVTLAHLRYLAQSRLAAGRVHGAAPGPARRRSPGRAGSPPSAVREAWIAIAVIGPIPGTLIRRRASASCRALGHGFSSPGPRSSRWSPRSVRAEGYPAHRTASGNGSSPDPQAPAPRRST